MTDRPTPRRRPPRRAPAAAADTTEEVPVDDEDGTKPKWTGLRRFDVGGRCLLGSDRPLPAGTVLRLDWWHAVELGLEDGPVRVVPAQRPNRLIRRRDGQIEREATPRPAVTDPPAPATIIDPESELAADTWDRRIWKPA